MGKRESLHLCLDHVDTARAEGLHTVVDVHHSFTLRHVQHYIQHDIAACPACSHTDGEERKTDSKMFLKNDDICLFFDNHELKFKLVKFSRQLPQVLLDIEGCEHSKSHATADIKKYQKVLTCFFDTVQL